MLVYKDEVGRERRSRTVQSTFEAQDAYGFMT